MASNSSYPLYLLRLPGVAKSALLDSQVSVSLGSGPEFVHVLARWEAKNTTGWLFVTQCMQLLPIKPSLQRRRYYGIKTQWSFQSAFSSLSNRRKDSAEGPRRPCLLEELTSSRKAKLRSHLTAHRLKQQERDIHKQGYPQKNQQPPKHGKPSNPGETAWQPYVIEPAARID